MNEETHTDTLSTVHCSFTLSQTYSANSYLNLQFLTLSVLRNSE